MGLNEEEWRRFHEKQEQPNNQTRRHIQWAVAKSDLPAGAKTFLQAVLLRMRAEGDPSTASYSRLALDTSFSIARVYHYAKLTEESGFLERHRISRNRTPHLRVIVTPEILDRTTPLLRHLWHLPPTERNSEEGWEEWEEWKIPHLGSFWAETQRRFTWERCIRDSRLQASAKGTAWALALLLNSRGYPFRRYLTLAELTPLSGYDQSTVRSRLRELEAVGWMMMRRKRGRGGGYDMRLCFPDEVLESLLEGYPDDNAMALLEDTLDALLVHLLKDLPDFDPESFEDTLDDELRSFMEDILDNHPGSFEDIPDMVILRLWKKKIEARKREKKSLT